MLKYYEMGPEKLAKPEAHYNSLKKYPLQAR